MPFARLVEAGRVCLVTFGEEYGTLLAIVDIIDGNRVLVDGPGQQRRQYNLKRLALTDLKIDIARSAKKTAVLKAWQDAGVTEKFAASNWGRKLAAREKKKNLNDYERHQILMRRIKRAGIVKKALGK